MGTAEASSSKKPLLLFGLIGVGVILAVVLFVATAGGDSNQQPNDAASKTPYICLDDGEQFSLTPAEFDQVVRSGGTQYMVEAMRGSPVLIRCPKCSQISAIAAEKCPTDGTLFARFNRSQQLGQCPRCKWKPGQS